MRGRAGWEACQGWWAPAARSSPSIQCMPLLVSAAAPHIPGEASSHGSNTDLFIELLHRAEVADAAPIGEPRGDLAPAAQQSSSSSAETESSSQRRELAQTRISKLTTPSPPYPLPPPPAPPSPSPPSPQLGAGVEIGAAGSGTTPVSGRGNSFGRFVGVPAAVGRCYNNTSPIVTVVAAGEDGSKALGS